MSIGPPIPEIQHFQNLTLKIEGQGHSSRSQSRYRNLSTHIPFVACQSALPFLGYSYLKIWRWKFKVKVMDEVKVENHNMGPTFSWLTFLSFHFNQASHSWVTTFSKFYLENQGSRSWVRSQFEVTMWAFLRRAMNCGTCITGQLRQPTTSLHTWPITWGIKGCLCLFKHHSPKHTPDW